MHEWIPISIGVAGSLTATAVAGSITLSEKLRHTLCPPHQATFLADALDFDQVADDAVTLVGKNGSLTRTFTIGGKDYNLCMPGDLERCFKQRQFLWDQLAQHGVTLKIITIRDEIERSFTGIYDHPILQELHNRWMAPFKRTFRNRHFLVLTEHPTLQGPPGWSLKKQTKSIAKGKLDNLCLLIENALADFGVRLLRNDPGLNSELLTFWASLLNGTYTPLQYEQNHLSDRLVSRSVTFDNKNCRFHLQDGNQTTHGAICSLQKWGDESSSTLFKELSSIQGRLVFLHLLEGTPKAKSLIQIEDQRRQQQLFYKSEKTESEFQVAHDLIDGDEASLYRSQFSILMLADTEAELNQLIQDVRRIFLSYGVICVLEHATLEYVWRCLFPGKETFIRAHKLLSHNLAHVIQFEKEPLGSNRSDWGEGPIRYLKTLSGGTYGLNLHISEHKEELGHSLVVAPSGSGKTTLIQHLIAGALRHPDLRVYIFDRFYGTRIFTEACGGTYLDFTGQDRTKLNPFVVEDTAHNRTRLRHLLSLMAQENNSDASELDLILSLLFATPQDKRLLKWCEPALFSAHSSLARKLRPWCSGPYQAWLNGEEHNHAFDALDLSSSRLIGFEFTSILNDERLVGPLTFYIMERIRDQVREHALPHWLFVDESKPMTSVPFFKQYLEVALKESRKLRGIVTLCFQSVQDILTTGMSDIILQQCKTKILFPNTDASEADLKVYQEVFHLTHNELDYISGKSKAAQKANRTILLKKPGESVILNVDLLPLGNYQHLFKSGSEFIKRMNQVKAAKGEAWVDAYLKSH